MDLVAPLEELAKQLTTIELARAAADAAAEVMLRGTASVLGGDLSMSRLGAGDVEFETGGTRPGHASVVGVGATFALADGGRRRRTTARARTGSALATPWGPRAFVEGSTWPGFGITDRYGADALAAAAAAAVDAIEWGD